MEENKINIWAKSPIKFDSENQNEEEIIISLNKHVSDILNNLEKVKQFIKDDNLYELIKISVLLHDLGKALPYFQIRNVGNRKYKPFDVTANIPHSIFSLFLINKEKLKEIVSKYFHDKQEEYTQYVLSAVAYHHWRNNFEEVIRYSNTDIEKILNSNLIEEIIQNLKEDLNALFNGQIDLIRFDEIMAKEILNGAQIQNYAVPPYNLYWLPKRLSFEKANVNDWIKIAGFLMRCDHFASFCEKENDYDYEIEISGLEYDKIKSKINEDIKNKIGSDNEINLWQSNLIEEKKLYDKNVILIAPTGSGKTEFAYLWSKGEKTFYTLPLRSAVNQIYKRSEKIFGEDKAGLLHSDADVYLLGDGNESENLESYSLSRQLSYPFMVSTGDQFFPYALRPPSFERIYSTFSYSRLVIDEVQAYDPKAAAIVVKYLQDIYKMGGKFLLITATLPTFIREELIKRIKKDSEQNHDFEVIDYYEENEICSNIKKHKLDFIEQKNKENEFKFSDELIKQIISKAKENNGQRVLIVVNTVKLAIDTFKKIKKETENEKDFFVDLLHSRFTFEERQEKEKMLEKEFSNPKPPDEKKTKILVATQVIEASLDLDADILYTEFAPIDSLVQRMGRVLRRYKDESPKTLDSPNVYITIFENGIESGGYRVYSDDLIGITMKLLTNDSEELKKWCESNYKNKEWRKKTFDLFQKVKNKMNDEELILTESKKKMLVEQLYNKDLFAEDNSYLSEFYKTLDILDAGFMAERKEEANRIFREISSIKVVPESKVESMKNDLRSFFFNNTEKKNLFIKFKREIFNKYIYNVHFPNWKYESIKNREDIKLTFWLELNSNDFSPTQINQLKKWCKNIFIIKVDYDTENGIDKYDFPETSSFI